MDGYEYVFFNKKDKIFKFIKDVCYDVCKEEFDRYTLSNIYNGKIDGGIAYAKKQNKFVKGSSISSYIIAAFLIYSIKINAHNANVVEYTIELVCSNKNMGKKIIELFETYIYQEGKRITIILDSIDSAWKFYEKIGYKIIDEAYDAKGRLITKKMIKIMGTAA